MRRAIVCVVGGVVLTVAQAWGTRLLFGFETTSGYWLSTELGGCWPTINDHMARHARYVVAFDFDTAPDHWEEEGARYQDTRFQFPGWMRRTIERHGVAADRDPRFVLIQDGLPFRSFQSWWRYENGALAERSAGIWLGDRHGGYWIYRNLLPSTPLWGGFVANTLVNGALAYGGLAGFAAVRKRFRRRRGVCAKCNYDLRGIDSYRCPECGARIHVPRTA